MEILELIYGGKKLSIQFELEENDQYKTTQDYFLYGKNGQRFVIRQDYMRWEMTSGQLPADLCNAIIDELVLRYEKNLLAVCYYAGERQILTISNLEHMAHDHGYHLMLNRTDLGYLFWHPEHGWKIDLWLKFKGHWITSTDIDIIIERIEQGDIPWLKKLPRPGTRPSPSNPS